MSERKCCVPGCNRLGQHMGKYRKDGTPFRRSKCTKHHSMQYGIGDWKSKQFRKSYCENRDGRLGFKCRCNGVVDNPSIQIDVDHKDGNPFNNDPENLQSLCKNCHAMKTYLSKDYSTPGRKTMKASKQKKICFHMVSGERRLILLRLIGENGFSPTEKDPSLLRYEGKLGRVYRCDTYEQEDAIFVSESINNFLSKVSTYFAEFESL